MPRVFPRMRMKPPTLFSPRISTLTLASASSPKIDRAYRFAARKPASPSSAHSGVRHCVGAWVWRGVVV